MKNSKKWIKKMKTILDTVKAALDLAEIIKKIIELLS